MLDFFANLFGYVLNFIYNLTSNYGIAIILFTILLKLLMLPMTIKQQKSMKKSSEMQVKAKEIQEKYSNDPQKMNQEMMELYKNNNAFGGCFTSILQIIVILSIFFLVSKPLTFMKKVDTNIINDYTKQITKEDSESGNKRSYTEIAIIKKYANDDDKVYINMNFLGLDLSDIPTENITDWKVYIIPLLYIVTSITSMKMNTKASIKDAEKAKEKKKEENKEDGQSQEEMMAEMNKNMGYIMPFMTVSIALIAPLGLALYWFVNNVLSIVERIILNKILKDEDNKDEVIISK